MTRAARPRLPDKQRRVSKRMRARRSHRAACLLLACAMEPPRARKVVEAACRCRGTSCLRRRRSRTVCRQCSRGRTRLSRSALRRRGRRTRPRRSRSSGLAAAATAAWAATSPTCRRALMLSGRPLPSSPRVCVMHSATAKRHGQQLHLLQAHHAAGWMIGLLLLACGLQGNALACPQAAD